MTNLEFLQAQLRAEEAGQGYVTAVIVSAEGSAPRDSGKMLVLPNGTTMGTVGGGEAERLARLDALDALAAGQSRVVEYELSPEGIGTICGGRIRLFLEVNPPTRRLLVCGAGHVGGALLRLGRFCGYQTLLADDRPAAEIQDKIDLADRFFSVLDYQELPAQIGPGACIVIATYGHSRDREALEAALRMSPRYLGMIGSRGKVRTLWEELRKKGVPEETLRAIYAPVGLDLGGKTPEEIALSVLAEIQQVLHGTSGRPLSDL